MLSKVKDKRYLGIELNLISILFATSSKVLNKFSLVSLSPVVGAILTSVFAALFTFIFLMVSEHKVSIIKDKIILLVGLTNGVGVILQYIALSNLSPITVTLIARMYIIYIFALGYIFLKEKITFWDCIAIAAAIVGSVLISTNRLEMGDNIVGIICSFIYPFMYAANNIAAKYMVEDHSATEVLFYNHVVSAGLLVIYLLFNLNSIGSIPFQGVAFNFAGAFCNGFMSLLLFFTALKYITAGHANIIRTLEPIITILVSSIFFPVAFTWQIALGAVFIIIANAIVVLKKTYNER